MDKFGAMVRIGDSTYHKTQEQVAGVLRLHIETGCWSSSRQHDVRPGMPVIASHAGAGQGQFLVGVFTGEPMAVPWESAREYAEHVGHSVRWMDAVFVGDPDLIKGAQGRALTWLSIAAFNDAWGRLRVQDAIQ